MTDVIVVGAGPAGLMAAETLLDNGHSVTIVDAKPSFGRKLLMAGKSGLNLTKDEPKSTFLNAYGSSQEWLESAFNRFGPEEVKDWARGLGQDIFTGSTGRVFPKAMKASPLLRSWLTRLEQKGASFLTRHTWLGFEDSNPVFESPEGKVVLAARATVLALGGASWARLGSDGKWAAAFEALDIAVAPFEPSNMGVNVDWSPHMKRHLGTPIKNCRLSTGRRSRIGEFVISAKGLEGSAIYAFSPEFRAGEALVLDLAPDLTEQQIVTRLQKGSRKASLTNKMRKAANLSSGKIGLFKEFSGDARDPETIAALIKALEVSYSGVADLNEAISVAGGVRQSALSSTLMVKAMPGIFCAGEMLDWEAPTGGYLITACLATGRAAGLGASKHLQQS